MDAEARCVLASVALVASLSSCTRAPFTPAPNMRITYYDCLESTPNGLVALYTVHYYNTWAAKTLYDNKVFVFKNIEVTDLMLLHLDGGYACSLFLSYQSSLTSPRGLF